MDNKKVSRDEQRSVIEQAFRAGFTAGMAYRGCPKFDYTDPMAMFKAMEVCDKMFELMERDGKPDYNGKDQIQSIARLLGLDEK